MSKLLYLFLFPAFLSAQEPTLSVLPTPRDVARFDARFRIDAETRVVLQDPENELDAFTAQQIVEEIRSQFGLALEIQSEQATTNWSNVIYLGKFGQDSKAEELAETIDLPEIMDLGEEGYYLQVSDSLVVLCANTSAGLFNAAMTVTQLVGSATESQLPGTTLSDHPQMRVRGFSIDLSHGSVPNLQTLKDLIRFLSRYKMNTCVLYLGVMFDYQNHPKIADGRGVLSKSEIRELQNFAEPYHVDIIPAISILSDWEPILSLPEYRNLALYPGAARPDPSLEGAHQLLEALLVEISDAFTSPQILLNIGLWQEDEADQDFHFDEQTVGQHIRKGLDILKKLDKQPLIALGDGWMSFSHQLPPETMLVTQNPESVVQNSFYQDPREILVITKIPNGQTLFPDFFRVIAQIGKMRSENSQTGGMIAMSRTQSFGPVFQQLNRYGFAYTAEAMWASKSAELQDFNRIYFSQRYGDFDAMAELVFFLLSDFPLDFWQQMWRHPYLVASSQNSENRILRMRSQFQQVLNLLNRATNAEVRSFDYLEYAAKHGVWLADKLELSRELQELRNGSGSSEISGSVNNLIAKCQSLIEELNALIEGFQLLWLRSNRMQDSPRFLDLYSLQVAYWQEVISDLETGQLARDPVLPGQWIVHPQVGNMREAGRRHAFFRKTFEVTPGFKNASLLAIPDSRMKVYINGAFLDEVVRPELYTGVRVWDIGSVLQPGKNVIAVEAWHDAASAPTAIRIYGEVEYEFGKTLRITTDAYWKTSTQEEADWQKLGFFDVQWLNALPVAKDLTIISPNFRSGRPAMVTR